METKNLSCKTDFHFRVYRGQLEAFSSLWGRYVEKTRKEPGCGYCGFSVDGQHAYCREGFMNAEALLAHLENVHSLLNDVLNVALLEDLEIHGPEEELTKLREPLAGMRPRFSPIARCPEDTLSTGCQ